MPNKAVLIFLFFLLLEFDVYYILFYEINCSYFILIIYNFQYGGILIIFAIIFN